MPLKTALLFDLGGVLVDWNPRYLYRKVYGEAELEFFLAEVCTSPWNLSMDEGRTFADAIAEKQQAWPDYREAIGWWETRWEEMLQGPIQETVDLLGELKDQGHPLFALTNWSAQTFPRARERFAFLSWFREIVVSGEVGLVKPDPAIFRLTLARCGLRAEDTVFIDDALPNVEAARSLGLDAIAFTGPGPLRQSLVERGLIG